MRNWMLPKLAAGAGAALLVLISGCASPKERLVYGKYAKLGANSTQAEVREILGEPDHKLPDVWLYEEPKEHRFIKVEFNEQGVLKRKEWIDTQTQTWEDSDETGLP